MPRKPKRCPVVMIHGAFCGPWAFDRFRKPFEAAGYDVYAPCLRFHEGAGERSRALGRTSLLDYASDLEKFIAGLGSVPILIGHSMGGLLAQILAARAKASALVLLAPSAPWGVLPSTMFEIASGQTMLMTGDYWSASIAPNYKIAAAHALDKLSPTERHAVYARFVPESGLATFEILHWSFDLRRAARVQARDVTCPVLCLVGSGDKINPPSTVARIAARYHGRARFEELPAHSHWLIAEKGYQKIAGRALEWLDDIRAGDRRNVARG